MNELLIPNNITHFQKATCVCVALFVVVVGVIFAFLFFYLLLILFPYDIKKKCSKIRPIHLLSCGNVGTGMPELSWDSEALRRALIPCGICRAGEEVGDGLLSSRRDFGNDLQPAIVARDCNKKS